MCFEKYFCHLLVVQEGVETIQTLPIAQRKSGHRQNSVVKLECQLGTTLAGYMTTHRIE